MIEPISNIYTDDMGRFPVRSRSVNHYIVLACYVDTNVILVDALQSRHDRRRLAAYDRIISHIKSGNNAIDLQVLDKEVSEAYKLAIEDKCN